MSKFKNGDVVVIEEDGLPITSMTLERTIKTGDIGFVSFVEPDCIDGMPLQICFEEWDIEYGAYWVSDNSVKKIGVL